MRRILRLTALALALAAPGLASAAERHAIAMHGEPDLGADFTHLPYANPDAPKGGRIDYALQGTFDSLNPFIVQGDAARGLFDQSLGNNVFEPLMMRSRGEAFTLYPLIARSVETDADRSFITFRLDPRARFSDGQPITQDDVIFSMELLRDKARPLYRRWIGLVERMEKVDQDGIRFELKPEADRELPLLLALLPVFPKHATNAETFDRTTLKPMVGSGPYTITEVKPGESIVLRRNPDYWAKDLPSKRGFDNYDEIRITYFRDGNTMFEAFKKGLVSVFPDTDTGRWASGYDFPAALRGEVVKDAFETGLPSGMYGFVMNTRRRTFEDRAVRAALVELFDFEWANRTLYFDSYRRTTSYFDGSELGSTGRPASEAERALLASFPDAVAPDILAGTWRPAISDGSGRDRDFLRKGYDALKAAGWSMKDGRMTSPQGSPLAFEVLLRGKGGEALAMAWQRTLARIGIALSIRSVDDAQYQQRLQTYDYDVILQLYPSSLSPGAEQIGRWGSDSRDRQGEWAFAGASSPALDATITAMLSSRDEETFVTAVRAFDRVLLSGAYVVPLYYQPKQWVARWKGYEHPDVTPVYGYQFQTWWKTPD